ncbi:MAG: hypothetical protein BMS9Abin33_0241 [Gammaproteobacteria bacterium]|nr:MAG: hypothetical protein BMS9Abin33_0241 [Gammaproteobacteria bacterium]
MSILTVKQIIIRITIIVSLAELVIMFGLANIPHSFGNIIEALIDVSLLVIVTSPIIYIWVIKPFVIARDEALSQLTNMAYSDQLTELPNRRFLLKYMEKLLAETVRHKYFGALLLIDLDNFKPINDTYGHDAGDVVLVEVAKRLLSSIRTEDVAGRVGGDEFIILLNRLNSNARLAGAEAVNIAKKLQNSLNEPIDYKGEKILVGSSFGIRLLGVETIRVEAAIREADLAMYRAKQEGRGRIVLFE